MGSDVEISFGVDFQVYSYLDTMMMAEISLGLFKDTHSKKTLSVICRYKYHIFKF